MPRQFTFRQCLLLSLPALIIGLVVRAAFLHATPECFYGPDSNSYFNTARALWNDHAISFGAKRRYLYPLLLAFGPMFPGNTAQFAAAFQHLLGLGVVLGVGWITGNLVRFPKLWIPPVTILAAVWPRMLWYEHEMIADSVLLATLVYTTALALPVTRLKNPRHLFWFLLGLCAIVATKPHGRPFWLGLMVAAVLATGNPLRWGRRALITVGAALFLIVATGSSSQGIWLLLSSALPLVNSNAPDHAEYRQILKPWIEETRADLPNYAFEQSKYKKPLDDSSAGNPLGPEWEKLCKDPREYSKVAKALAFGAIKEHPLEFAGVIYRKSMRVMADRGDANGFKPAAFWDRQNRLNDGRWAEREPEMRLLYEMDHDAYLQMSNERSTRVFFFDPWLQTIAKYVVWTHCKRGAPGQAPLIRPACLGALALLGLFACFLPSRFRAAAFVWMPAGLYLLLVFAVGDALGRYLLPVEWAGLVLAALGLDAVLSGVVSLVGRMTARASRPDCPEQ